ncbi:proline-rich receptor-like protein kinase PERK14 [Triticum aestivum]|uniref:proline-rich receptor-like protein kinase PERK14 n=1 Tax=Triticum aestivum TaxID=4565 RepID=UPI001D009582|nr:proline-rich receptor-like protein kinase PERK14 [Triticum aestivum]
MATNCPDENDGVAGHPGAPPPPLAQRTPAPDPNSLPSTSQQLSPSFFLPPPCNYPSQPDEWSNISAPDNDDAINASVFSYIDYLNASLPPLSDATPFAPSVQPPLPPPSQQQQHRYPSQPDEESSIPALGNNDAMNASLFGDYFNASSPPPPSSATPLAPSVQPAMQVPHYIQQLPAMATMGETQYYYPGAAPEHAVLPEAPPPPAVQSAKPAGGRRRGRPRGSTAKSKSKSKVANTAAAAGRRQQEAATASAIIARQETVGAGSAEVEEEEQKLVEYADTNIPGVRFKPTDAEIIWYLERKYHGH